jgi:hypothetical protein
MSLKVKIGRLYMIFKHQKQRCKEENVKREGKGWRYFVSKVLKKVVDLF